jgi:hypothetical protein
MKNQRLLQIFFVSSIFILIIYLLNSPILGEFLTSAEYKPGVSNLFADYNILISWLDCNYLGFDVYKLESVKNCPSYTTIILYGPLWLNLPFNDVLKIFYLEYLPFLTILLFLASIIKITNPKNFIEYTCLILAILNPSTLLLFQRLGFDIFVFILVIFVNFNRVYFINWFIIFCLTFIKIYPAILGINIFLENIERSFKKNLILIFSIILISIIYLYFHYDEYKISLIDGGFNRSQAGYHFLFSLNSLPKIFKYIFDLNYIFMLFIFYFIFILMTKWFYNKLSSDYIKITENTFSKNGKLFILGGYIVLFCFVTYSNLYYREVFILLLLPYLISLKNKNINNLLNFLFFLIIVRFLILFPYAYLNVHDGIIYLDGVRQFSKQFLISISVKSIFDFIMMSLVSSILLLKSKKFFQFKKRSLSNN